LAQQASALPSAPITASSMPAPSSSEYVQRFVHTRIPRSTTDEDRKQRPQAEVHLRQRRAVTNEHEAIAVSLTDVRRAMSRPRETRPA
jgi:hypothetical protein